MNYSPEITEVHQEFNTAADKLLEQAKEIPDPVVLYPVREGYLIVTAWGDEASDPDVVNEVNN